MVPGIRPPQLYTSSKKRSAPCVRIRPANPGPPSLDVALTNDSVVS